MFSEGDKPRRSPASKMPSNFEKLSLRTGGCSFCEPHSQQEHGLPIPNKATPDVKIDPQSAEHRITDLTGVMLVSSLYGKSEAAQAHWDMEERDSASHHSYFNKMLPVPCKESETLEERDSGSHRSYFKSTLTGPGNGGQIQDASGWRHQSDPCMLKDVSVSDAWGGDLPQRVMESGPFPDRNLADFDLSLEVAEDVRLGLFVAKLSQSSAACPGLTTGAYQRHFSPLQSGVLLSRDEQAHHDFEESFDYTPSTAEEPDDVLAVYSVPLESPVANGQTAAADWQRKRASFFGSRQGSKRWTSLPLEREERGGNEEHVDGLRQGEDSRNLEHASRTGIDHLSRSKTMI